MGAESPMNFSTKQKVGSKVVLLHSEAQDFEKMQIIFLSLIIFGEYTSGGGSNKMHLHTSDKQLRRFLFI